MSRQADGPKFGSQGTFYPGERGLTGGDTVGSYLDDTRVAKFLVRKREKRYCIECLKNEVQLPHSQVEQQLSRLAKNRLYKCEQKKCSACKALSQTYSATRAAR